MCFVFVWEQTATCATYSVNGLVFITEMESVYSAVRTGPLNEAVCACATYSINWLVFITEMKSVYNAVRTGPLNESVCAPSFKVQCDRTVQLNYPHCCRRYSCLELLFHPPPTPPRPPLPYYNVVKTWCLTQQLISTFLRIHVAASCCFCVGMPAQTFNILKLTAFLFMNEQHTGRAIPRLVLYNVCTIPLFVSTHSHTNPRNDVTSHNISVHLWTYCSWCRPFTLLLPLQNISETPTVQTVIKVSVPSANISKFSVSIWKMLPSTGN
jgi:hypothetical protein